jgi:hypothetical protein
MVDDDTGPSTLKVQYPVLIWDNVCEKASVTSSSHMIQGWSTLLPLSLDSTVPQLCLYLNPLKANRVCYRSYRGTARVEDTI